MEHDLLERAVEAVLFAAGEPVPLARLLAVFGPEGVDREGIEAALERLRTSLADRALEVVAVAGGFQLRTRPLLAVWVARLETAKPVRLSRASLETLAAVAYRQPMTRAEIEEVRGVDCGGVLKALLERSLVRIMGKKDVPGRPLLYGTTRKFLEVFCLSSLAELPSLRDLQEMGDGKEEG